MTNTSSQTSSRLVALSLLNILFCFFVMFIHVSSEPVTQLMQGSPQAALVTLLSRSVSFVVQGFLFLSGTKLFYHHKVEEPHSLSAYFSYLIRRYRTIYRPYLLCVLIYYCYFAATPYYSYKMSLRDYIHYVLVGDLVSHFYYIVILAQFTLLLPLWVWLVRVCTKRRYAALLLAGCLAVTVVSCIILPSIPALASSPVVIYSDRLCTSYIIYFFAGCLFGQHYDKLRALILHRRIWFYLAFAAAFVLDPVMYTLQKMGWTSLHLPLEWLHILYCIAAILGMLALALAAQEQMEKRSLTLPTIVQSVDSASYPIYLWHCLLIYIVNINMLENVSSIATRYLIRAVIVMIATPLICIAWQKLHRLADRILQ